MKYIVLFITAIILCSCSHGSIVVEKFNNDEHSYLIFRNRTSYGFEVLHDPNCRCFTLN